MHACMHACIHAHSRKCMHVYLRTYLPRCASFQPFTHSFLVPFVHSAFVVSLHIYPESIHTYVHTCLVRSGSVVWCGVVLARQVHVHCMMEKTPCQSRRWGLRGCTLSMLAVAFMTCRPGLKVFQPLQVL